MLEDEETLKMPAIRLLTDCLYHDHVYPRDITEKAIAALLKHKVPIDTINHVVHFQKVAHPQNHPFPTQGHKFVGIVDEDGNTSQIDHWQLTDGTVLRHATNDGILDVTSEVF